MRFILVVVQILSYQQINMDIFKGDFKLIFYLVVIIGATLATPMFYKKKENDIYEPGKWKRSYGLSGKNK